MSRHKRLLPLPPLFHAQSVPLPQLRPAQSAPGPHVSRRTSSEDSMRPGGPDHAAASLWPRRSSRIAPANSSPLTEDSVAQSRQEQEQEGEDQERLTGAPPHGPHGERVRVLMAAIQGGLVSASSLVVSASALPAECIFQSPHDSRQRSCLHNQSERETEDMGWEATGRATARGRGGEMSLTDAR